MHRGSRVFVTGNSRYLGKKVPFALALFSRLSAFLRERQSQEATARGLVYTVRLG
jgi:hypothetical protein